MKKLILAVLVLLMWANTWAQAPNASTRCNMQITHEVTAPSCENGMDGMIILKVNGAASPVTVLWSDQEKGEVRRGVSSGQYIATVRDVHGCVKKYNVVVPKGRVLQQQLSIQVSKRSGVAYLEVRFSDNSIPATVQIKNLSKGIRAPWTEYKGDALQNGLYAVEAYNQAGCSLTEKIDLRID